MKFLLTLIILSVFLASCMVNDGGKIGIVALLEYDEPGVGEDIAIAVRTNVTELGEDIYSGDDITDAEVRINGIQLAHDGYWGYTDNGTLITLTPGNSYTITVNYKDKSFEETVTFPPKPAITSHANNDKWNEQIDTTLSWTLDTVTHVENKIEVNYFDTYNNIQYEVTLPPAVTSYTIPANTLADDKYINIYFETRDKTVGQWADFHDDSYILCKYRTFIIVETF